MDEGSGLPDERYLFRYHIALIQPESLLVAHPLVAEAAVIGVPDEIKGTAMVAFCVLRSAGILPAMSAKRENNADLTAISPSGDDDASKMLALRPLNYES